MFTKFKRIVAMILTMTMVLGIVQTSTLTALAEEPAGYDYVADDTGDLLTEWSDTLVEYQDTSEKDVPETFSEPDTSVTVMEESTAEEHEPVIEETVPETTAEEVFVPETTQAFTEPAEEMTDDVPQPADETTEAAETEAAEENTTDEEPVAFDSASCVTLNSGSRIYVHVTANPGAFPEGSYVEVREVSDPYNTVEDAVEVKRDHTFIPVQSVIVDVTVYDKDGIPVEPDTSFGAVTVTFGVDRMSDVTEAAAAKAADVLTEQVMALNELPDEIREYVHEAAEQLGIAYTADEIRTTVYHVDETYGYPDVQKLDSVKTYDTTMPAAALTLTCDTYSFSKYVLDFEAEQKADAEDMINAAEASEEEAELAAAGDLYIIPSGTTCLVYDIIDYLVEKYGDDSPITKDNYLVASSSSPDVKVNNDPVNPENSTVTVTGGGGQYDVVLFDKLAKPYTVKVSANEANITTWYGVSRFIVDWNDNKETDTEGVHEADRPVWPDVSGWYTLQFSIDGGDRFDISLFNEKTGIPADKFDGTDESLKLVNGHWKDNRTNWLFEFDKEILPEKYSAGGVSHTITYYVVQQDPESTSAAFPGYNNEGNVSVINGGSIKNTVRYEFEASLKWGDDSNRYNTRPVTTDMTGLTAGDFEIYVLDTSESNDPVPYSGEASVKFTRIGDGNEIQITMTGMPAYNSEGGPLAYSLRLKAPGHIPSQGPSPDPDPEKAVIYEYNTEYNNINDYAAVENGLYIHGTIVEFIQHPMTFTYNKIWVDDNLDPDARPDANIFIYVIPEDYIEDGHITDISKASAVQGTAKQSVPKKGENGEPYIYDIELKADVPMFDKNGKRLVYFALETGTKAYQATVNNAAAREDADVISAFEEIKTAGGTPKYVLNNGTITNEVKDVTVASVDVTLNVGVLEKPDVDNSATVVLEKYKYDPDEGTWAWVPVTYGDYLNYDGERAKTENVSEVLKGYREENITQGTDSYHLTKYDSEGNIIIYRWRETEIKINGTSIPIGIGTGAGNWDYDARGYDGKYDSVYIGESAPGAKGQGNVSLYVDGTVNLNTGSQYTGIVNNINAPMDFVITKVWKNNGENVTKEIGDDGGYIWVKILRNGEYYFPEGLPLEGGYVVIDKNNLTVDEQSWELTLSQLDRFDKYGKEYKYEIQEIKFNPTGYDHTLEYEENNVRISENESYKELKANLANVTGPGPGYHIELAVQKEWQDEGDTESRYPVCMALFAVEKGLVKIVNIDQSINWYHEDSVSVGDEYLPYGETETDRLTVDDII
ncbi:MAG: Cna B-type domain-containing protein, partial [Parasporobacterium sp.]|nr:Cna B-type domain-containing protein [Parasporobacterium sp.]